MIDLYKKVKYAGITWSVISQETVQEHTKRKSEMTEHITDFYGSSKEDENIPNEAFESSTELIDEESILTLFADSSITSTFFDIKSNVYKKSNIYKVLENIIKPKLAKRMGGKYSDIDIRLLKVSEFKKMQEDGIVFNHPKDFWLEDANEWTTNYAACISKNDEMFYDCVFYYNDVRPVIQIPFTALSEKQQAFLKAQTSIEEAPPEEEIINVEIDDRIEEHEVQQEIEEALKDTTEVIVDEQPLVPITNSTPEKTPKPKKIKYKNKKIKLSTEDIERLQRYYEMLCSDESINEEIRASLMDVLSQLI